MTRLTRLLTRRESFRLDLIEAAKQRSFRDNQKRQTEIVAAKRQTMESLHAAIDRMAQTPSPWGYKLDISPLRGR